MQSPGWSIGRRVWGLGGLRWGGGMGFLICRWRRGSREKTRRDYFMYQWAPGRGGKGILQLCFSSRMNNTSRIHNAWSELWELSCLSLLTFIYLVGWRCIEPLLLFCSTLQWLRETRGSPKVKDVDILFSLTRLAVAVVLLIVAACT